MSGEQERLPMLLEGLWVPRVALLLAVPRLFSTPASPSIALA